MYLDLLAQSNYISFNILIAKLFGLQVAVYISEIISISEKAFRKKVLVDNFTFLDREYIADRTSISVEDQLDYDNKLESLGIIEKRSVNEIIVNTKQLSYLITQEDEPIREEVISIMKKSKRLSKKVKDDYSLELLKGSITTQCDELRFAYYDWIDCVYAKDGFMTKKAVTHAQKLIDFYSDRNLDKALEVLEVASINGYRDVEWAINYIEDRNSRNNLKFTKQKEYKDTDIESKKTFSIGTIIK